MWRFSPALDAGFFIFWRFELRGWKFEEPEEELEGEFAQSERVSPARHVPSQFFWRDRKAVNLERATVKTVDRDIPMDSE